MKVAIQGIAGAFHHEAAEKLLKEPVEPVTCRTFQDVFTAVESGQAPRGLVAVENSLYGHINAVYQELKRGSVWVSGEVLLRIEQYLIGAAGHSKDLGEINRVLSQAPAIAQCTTWLKTNLPAAALEEAEDTATSVRLVVDKGDKSMAAIAGQRAAELYKGTVLAGPINDDPHNYTRFLLIQKDRAVPQHADKTSILMEIAHRPGSLYEALGVFARADVNLSKVESLPILGDSDHSLHYAFYIDFETGLQPDLNHPVLDELRTQGCQVTVLGSYRAQNHPS